MRADHAKFKRLNFAILVICVMVFHRVGGFIKLKTQRTVRKLTTQGEKS